MAKKQNKSPEIVKRPPIVVVMGHIDHGKSTLLDYIRNTNIVDKEAGGITQHLSAYVVTHETKEKSQEKITFLDTPGHSAFQRMRHRGADVADIAILIVSAEDGVKPQTLEALECIKAANIPYIVAINKIDKPGADIARTQASLIENEIYIEGMGGDIPWVAVSAKSGDGISDLLDLVILAADLNELNGDKNASAEGVIIEGLQDKKRGITATMIIKNGSIKSGMFVVAGKSIAPVRIMEDFTGQNIKEASLSEPIRIVGFDSVPNVGSHFVALNSKKEAEQYITDNPETENKKSFARTSLPVIPLLIKADVLGTLDAIKHELETFESDRIAVRVTDATVGDITKADVQNVSATKDAIIVGFNVKVDNGAQELADRLGVEIDTFSIIYELSEWLETALKNRTPKQAEEIKTGVAKILKLFSTQKNNHVLGGRMEEGVVKLKQTVRVLRRDIEVGRGTITNLQQLKSDVKEVGEGEFGMQINTKYDIAAGDYIECFDTIIS
ncbi:translation initiation factor IF-2 [Candidatus Kaiserbacteria bacterium]|nr:translation initiation factor IF-2 [Candidatus Kaiserbacteria bacterium]